MKHIISIFQALIIISVIVGISLFFEISWEPKKLDWIEEADRKIEESRTSANYHMTGKPLILIKDGMWYDISGKRLTQWEPHGTIQE